MIMCLVLPDTKEDRLLASYLVAGISFFILGILHVFSFLACRSKTPKKEESNDENEQAAKAKKQGLQSKN